MHPNKVIIKCPLSSSAIGHWIGRIRLIVGTDENLCEAAPNKNGTMHHVIAVLLYQSFVTEKNIHEPSHILILEKYSYFYLNPLCYIILKHIATTYLSKRPPGTSTSHKLFQMPIHHTIPFPNLQTKEEKTKSIDWRCKLADLIDYWPAPGTIPQWMYNISIAAGLGRIFGGIRGHWYLIKPTFEIPIRIKIALNTKSKMGL